MLNADEIEKKLNNTMSNLSELDQTAARKFLSEIQSKCDVTFRLDKPLHELSYDKQSEALSRWFCENVLGIDPDDIDGAIAIDHDHDYGIDMFHIETVGETYEQYIAWGQTKFSPSLDYEVVLNEILVHETTIKYLEDVSKCPNANTELKHASRDFGKEGGLDADRRKLIYFVVAGDLAPQAQAEFDQFKSRLENQSHKGGEIIVELYNLERILKNITDPITPEVEIEFDGLVLVRPDTLKKTESLIGFVKADVIVPISKKHGITIYSDNPRQTLGKKSLTFKPITETLAGADNERFWKLSNGITATCNEWKEISKNPFTYEVKNLKIVNGRQTLFTLEEFDGKISNVTMSISLHQINDRTEGRLISQTTNTQNPVKPIDMISGLPELRSLETECQTSPIDPVSKKPLWYYERQTMSWKQESSQDKSLKTTVTPRRVLEKNSTARAYYAYALHPVDALMDKAILYSTIPPATNYNRVFQNRKIRDLIIPHIFKQTLVELGQKWNEELKVTPQDDQLDRKKRILGTEIVRYFILRFIKDTMDSLSPSDEKTIEDKLIKIFTGLKTKDKMPNDLLNIAQASYENFVACFDLNKKNTWPKQLLIRLDELQKKKQKPTSNDVPQPRDIQYKLKQEGRILLPDLLSLKITFTNSAVGDVIKAKLEEFNTNNP